MKKIKKIKRYVKCDWKELLIGERIKVVGGPYWRTQDNKKISIGPRGIFEVKGIEKNGILVYNKDTGFCFVFMGTKTISPAGTTLIPHTIRKVIKPI